MPAAASLDTWNVVLNLTELPRDEWLKIVLNSFSNTGDVSGTLRAQWAIIDETDGSVFEMLCEGTATLDPGQSAAMTMVGDSQGGFCQVAPLDAGTGPLMHKFSPDEPDPLVFAFRVYVDGNTPPPWPGQDGQTTQAGRLTVDVQQGTLPVLGDIPGLNTAHGRVVAASAGGGTAASILVALLGG